jgi:predicted nucleotidyltransferase
VVAAEVIDAVRRELAAVEAAEGVRVLYAVESGSRAWGFASADSDYDVRLVYVHRPAWYLSIDRDEQRDVIERQLPGDIDLSGWDLRKALRLFARSNPPLVEWLDSPVVYHEADGLADRLRGLLRTFYSPAAALHHYLRMAQNNWHAYCRRDRVRLKKYLYVLRPLLAARWIEQDRGPVPMLFRSLFVTVADRPDLLTEIEALLVRKTAGGELGEGPRIGPIHEFAATELERLPSVAAGMTKSPVSPAPLDELFRETLNAAW